MFGQWESQTRKLNRHYQSVRRLGFWNMIRHIRRAVFESTKSENSLNYDSTGYTYEEINEETKQMEEKIMYVNSLKVHMDSEWKTEDGKAVIGAYNSVPAKFIGLADTKIKNLTDNGDPLASGTNRFLGYQLTIFTVSPEWVAANNKKSDNENLICGRNDNLSNSGGINLASFVEGTHNEYGQDGATIAESNVPFGSLVKSNFMRKYHDGDGIVKQDVSQKDTTDFTGSTPNFMEKAGPYSGIVTWSASIVRSGYTDLNSDVTIQAAIKDEDFNNTFNPKQIPVIGQTFYVHTGNSSYAAPGRFYYVFTPTVFNAKGDVIELNH